MVTNFTPYQSKKCTIVVDNEVECRIGGLRPEHIDFFWDKFGFYAEGYQFTPAFQLKKWDGKIRFFDKRGKTHTKLIEELVPYLVEWDYEVDIDDRRLPSKEITTIVNEHFFGIDGFTLRDYQVKAINDLLHNGSGFGILGTGAGKTSITAVLSAVLVQHGMQTIVIVPSTDLVNQTADEFKRFLVNYPEISIGVYSGDTKEIDNHIVVATWQSLQNVPHYMSYFQAVIVDEAHQTKATVIRDLINENGKHISHRYGVTGTFPKHITDKYTLHSSIGRIVIEVPTSWLIEKGYLSTIEINLIETQDTLTEFSDYTTEKTHLSRNEDRLQSLAHVIEGLPEKHGNTLVLVNSVAQGQNLQSMIPGSIFLYGDTKTADRKDQYKQYADRDDLIVIATFGIASTGISIDRIFCLVFIDSGKSFIRSIQSAGRGLRKKGDKNHVVVYDIYSKLKFSKKHFKERKKYYEEAKYPIIDVSKLKYKERPTNEKGLAY
jgi:superfamily II DNA or RNA helicase